MLPAHACPPLDGIRAFILLLLNSGTVVADADPQQEERIKTYKLFKEGSKRILVATDLVGRGIDIERVNIVINYDMPETDEKRGSGADTYLHRVRGCMILHTACRSRTGVLWSSSACRCRLDTYLHRVRACSLDPHMMVLMSSYMYTHM